MCATPQAQEPQELAVTWDGVHAVKEPPLIPGQYIHPSSLLGEACNPEDSCAGLHDAQRSSPPLARILSRHCCQPATSCSLKSPPLWEQAPDRWLCPAQPWAGVCLCWRCCCYFQGMRPLFYCMLSPAFAFPLAIHAPLFRPLFTHYERKKKKLVILGDTGPYPQFPQLDNEKVPESPLSTPVSTLL